MVEVLEPKSLREQMQGIAGNLLAIYAPKG
jgi:hypothetical protein